MKRKKMTVYDAAKRASEFDNFRIEEIKNLQSQIAEKDKKISELTTKKKYSHWIKIKAASFDVTEEYLRAILPLLPPLSGIISIEYGRY